MTPSTSCWARRPPAHRPPPRQADTQPAPPSFWTPSSHLSKLSRRVSRERQYNIHPAPRPPDRHHLEMTDNEPHTHAWGTQPEMFGPRHEHRLGIIMAEVRKLPDAARVLDAAVGLGQLAGRMQ